MSMEEKEVIVKDHPDGEWNTSEYLYRDRKIMIKSKQDKGIKCHVFFPGNDKVDFTLRYNFIQPSRLLQKAKDKIDKKYPPPPFIDNKHPDHKEIIGLEPDF